MMYQLTLRSVGRVFHSQAFAAEDDTAAIAIAGLVFHSTTELWDTYDLWEGSRLITYDLWEGSRLISSSLAQKLRELSEVVEQAAITIEESIRMRHRYAKDDAMLTVRVGELRAKYPRQDAAD